MGSEYEIVELVGTSDSSWEDAAMTAVATAGDSLRDLRVAEVEKLDLQIADDGSVAAFRTKVKLSFNHESGVQDPDRTFGRARPCARMTARV